MNIYDVSKQAGVSIATVSRVMNGSGRVSESTRKRVLDVIEKNGYTPNAFARSLSSNTMSTVGILCSDSSDVYQAQAIYFLERELREHSYTAMLCCTGYGHEQKKDYLKLLLSRNVDAIFLVGSNFVENSPRGNSYIVSAAKKVPIFMLNGELQGRDIYSVLCDDYTAVRDITRLVLEKGSRAPVFLYRHFSYSGMKKIQGFQKACEEWGEEGREYPVISCPGPIRETVAVLEELKKKGTRFDAVIAADDELASGAVKYALRNHFQIPEEFQITGYNNSVLSVCSSPEITTVDNQVEFMCVTAVSQMLKVRQGKSLPQRMIYSGRIIEHQTTKL